MKATRVYRAGTSQGKPTARRCDLKIPFVKREQRSVVAAVRSLQRGDIFFSNPALTLDRLLRPLDRSLSPSLQPNICQQSSPSPVTVSERMNPYGAMMQSNGLFNEWETFMFMPLCEIIEEVLQVVIDLISRNAEIQFRGASRTSPLPHFAEHFPVYFVSPVEGEGRPSLRRARGHIPRKRLADIPGFGDEQLTPRLNVRGNQSGRVIDWRCPCRIDEDDLALQLDHNCRREP